MAFGNSQMYAALNITAITDLLDTRASGDTRKALWGDCVIPSQYSYNSVTYKTTANKTINYYRVAPILTGSEVQQIVFNVVCRGKTQADVEKIAEAVVKNVHRRTYHGYFIRCKVLAIIPPADSTDNYNQTVECELILKPEV